MQRCTIENENGTVPLRQIANRTVALTQNFDGVTAPALPAGWTTSASGGQESWSTTNGVADTLANSAFAPATTNAGLADLLSPTIPK